MAAHLIPETTDVDQQLADYYLRAERFAAAEGPLDALTSPAPDLAAIGFPPRPSETLHPALFAVWKDVFTRPLVYERAELSVPFPPSASNSGSTSAALRRSHRESSSNWSGAYITPRKGQMLTQVVGRWKVPEIEAAPDGPLDGTYGSSTWIGLDGQRSYLNSTLPQLGTGQFLNVTGAPGWTTRAWVQWWPLCPVTLSMVVTPDDLMAAWLVVLTPSLVLFVLVNVSRLRYTPFALCAPKVKMPPHVPNAVRPTVSGATAEWVMERPAICPNPDPMTLPSFEPVTFSVCLAASALAPGASTFEVRAPVSPKLIRMFSVEESPHRAVTRAVASRDPLSDTTATVTYRT